MPPAADRSTSVLRAPRQAFQVVFLMVGVLVFSAALTLRTVNVPGVLIFESTDPTPIGYTWSLCLFLLPIAGLGIITLAWSG